MLFQIRESYNFDLLNMLNILTGDEGYTQFHPLAYAEFGEALSEESRERLTMVTDALGNAMISPLLNFVLSFVPDFEEMDLLNLLTNEQLLINLIAQNNPRMAEKANQMLPLFRSVLPVLTELENMGFHEYWVEEWLPRIDEKRELLLSRMDHTQLNEKILTWFAPEEIPVDSTLYLCAFSAPHGIKIAAASYIADIHFEPEMILKLSLHEIFSSILDQTLPKDVLDQIAADPLIRLAFEKTNPSLGALERNTYLKKNIVEAVFLKMIHDNGVEPDPFEYLLTVHDGAYVFSVILLDWMNNHPKTEKQGFSEYFRELVQQMPLGSLMTAYQTALKNAGKELNL